MLQVTRGELSVVTMEVMAHASRADLLAKEEVHTDLSVLLVVKWEVEDGAYLESTVYMSRTWYDLDVGPAEETYPFIFSISFGKERGRVRVASGLNDRRR